MGIVNPMERNLNPVTARKTTTQPGRKRRTIVEETLPASNDVELEPDQMDITLEGVDDTEALQEVLSQFGETNVQLKVFQQTSTGPRFCYHCQTLDEEFIQKNWGGGDYTVRVFINGKYKKNIPIKIAASPTSLQPNAPSALPIKSDTDRHLQFLEEMVLKLITRENAAPPPPAGPSLTDLTTALANLDGLRGKQETGVDLIMKGIQLARDVNGETDWKTDLVRTAKDALPQVLTMFGKPPMPPNPGQPAIAGTVEPPEAMLRSGIAYLKQLAVNGVDPVSIIDLVKANAGQPQYQPIIHAIITKEFADFAAIDPEIGTEPFFSWFKPIFDGLRSELSPQNQLDVDSAGDVGDTGNAGNNGQPSPAGGKKPKG
jgi:hypothetical protein